MVVITMRVEKEAFTARMPTSHGTRNFVKEDFVQRSMIIDCWWQQLS
jgi:hypothetical protein